MTAPDPRHVDALADATLCGLAMARDFLTTTDPAAREALLSIFTPEELEDALVRAGRRDELAEKVAAVVEHRDHWQGTLHQTPDGWTEETCTAYRMAMEWCVATLSERAGPCPTCDGFGSGGPASGPETNGRCADCRGTGECG